MHAFWLKNILIDEHQDTHFNEDGLYDKRDDFYFPM